MRNCYVSADRTLKIDGRASHISVRLNSGLDVASRCVARAQDIENRIGPGSFLAQIRPDVSLMQIADHSLAKRNLSFVLYILRNSTLSLSVHRILARRRS